MKKLLYGLGVWVLALCMLVERKALGAPSFFIAGGVHVGSTGGGGGGGGPTLPTFAYQAETVTAWNAIKAANGGTAPAQPAQEKALDDMIVWLKARGDWAALKATTGAAIWNYSEANRNFAHINLVDGTSITEVGAPTFTPYVGYSTSSVSDYIDTGIGVTTLSQNNFSFGIISETAGDSNSSDAGAINGSNVGITIQCKTVSAAAGVRAMTSAGSQVGAQTNWNGAGMVAVSRTSSTAFSGYHFGGRVSSVTATSATPTGGGNIFILKANGGLTFSSRTISGGFCGAGLTDAQVADIHAALLTYQHCVRYGCPNTFEAGYGPASNTAEVIVVGATVQGLIAANTIMREGHTVIVVGDWREHQIGGMSTSGIGNIDFNNIDYLGGRSYDLIKDARVRIGGQTMTPSGGKPLVLCRDMLDACRALCDGTRTGGYSFPICWSTGIQSVTKTGTVVNSVTTYDGKTYTGQYILDCTYHGDVPRLAGCTMFNGCEAASGGTGSFELYNGWQGFGTGAPDHSTNQFDLSVSSYFTDGVSASGLTTDVITNVQTNGAATTTVQGNNFRPHLTTSAAQWVALDSTMPPNYNAQLYEPLLRWMAARTAASNPVVLTDVIFAYTLYKSTFEMNSFGPWSSDVPDSGRLYNAALTPSARETERQRGLDWDRGFFWTLRFSNDTGGPGGTCRVPAAIKTSMQNYGYDALTNLTPYGSDPLYWPTQYYIRAPQRIVGDYVVNGDDFNPNSGFKPPGSDPRAKAVFGAMHTVTTSCYAIDSHVAVPLDHSGTIYNSGGYFSLDPVGGGSITTKHRTPLPLEAFLPKATETTNLGVVFCMSATSVGFAAARMEFTTAQAAQSLAVYCVLAIEAGTHPSLSSVSYSAFTSRIAAEGDSVAPYLSTAN